MVLRECPVCGAAVKLEKLERHVVNVHPGKRPSLNLTVEERKTVRSRQGWEPHLGRLLLILGIILAIGVLLLDLAAAPPRAPTTPPVPSGHEGHGGGGVVVATAHDPTAIGLAILGPMIILAGVVLSRPDSLDSSHGAGLVAGLTLLYVDGILHWFAVLEHVTEPPSAAFFIISGGIQVAAVPLVLRRERALWWIGVALTVFFIELYIVSRIVPPPFSLEPEALESLGTLSKGIEVALLVALALFLGPRMVPASLREAVIQGPSLALLLGGVVVSDMTIGLEASWGLLSPVVFLLAALLLISLIICAALAHVRRTDLLVGLTFGVVAMLILGHAVYAVNYARAALLGPLGLCLVSGGLLAAPMFMSHWTRRRHLTPGSATV